MFYSCIYSLNTSVPRSGPGSRSSQFNVDININRIQSTNQAFHVIWLGSRLNCWFHVFTSHSCHRCMIGLTLALAICHDFCQLEIRRLNISGGLECAYVPGQFLLSSWHHHEENTLHVCIFTLGSYMGHGAYLNLSYSLKPIWLGSVKPCWWWPDPIWHLCLWVREKQTFVIKSH